MISTFLETFGRKLVCFLLHRNWIEICLLQLFQSQSGAAQRGLRVTTSNKKPGLPLLRWSTLEWQAREAPKADVDFPLSASQFEKLFGHRGTSTRHEFLRLKLGGHEIRHWSFLHLHLQRLVDSGKLHKLAPKSSPKNSREEDLILIFWGAVPGLWCSWRSSLEKWRYYCSGENCETLSSILGVSRWPQM